MSRSLLLTVVACLGWAAAAFNGNVFSANLLGVRTDGTRAPNGVDVFWDEQGAHPCWQANIAFGGRPITSDPAVLPACPGSMVQLPVNVLKAAAEVPCATWNPRTNQMPVGCTWFTTPAKPK